eukprot:s153_g9.t1
MALHNHSIRHWQELPTPNGCAKLWNPRVYAHEGQATEAGIVSTWGLPNSLSSFRLLVFPSSQRLRLCGQANGPIRTKNPVRLKEAGQLWVLKNDPKDIQKPYCSCHSYKML